MDVAHEPPRRDLRRSSKNILVKPSELQNLITDTLGIEGGQNSVEVKIRDNMSAHIDISKLCHNKKDLANGVVNLTAALMLINRDLDEGMSYVAITELQHFPIEQRDALLMFAIGKQLGLWEFTEETQVVEGGADFLPAIVNIDWDLIESLAFGCMGYYY